MMSLEEQHAVDDIGTAADCAVLAGSTICEISGTKWIALGEERSGDRGLAQHAALGPREKQAAEARVGGETGQLAAERSDLAACVERPQQRKQAMCIVDGIGR